MINCFIFPQDIQSLKHTVAQFQSSPLVNKIYALVQQDADIQIDGVEKLVVDLSGSTQTLQKIAAVSDAEFTVVYTKSFALDLGQFALERMSKIARDTAAGMVYADHYQLLGDRKLACPVIDYQQGSLRDDFNFGSLLLYNADMLKQAVSEMKNDFQFAGWYDLRLRVSQQAELLHINEYLYTDIETDNRKSGEKQFDYVDPRNRAVQIEMEQACTEHLKAIGGYLAPSFAPISFGDNHFEMEASVIIPVKNRIKTIGDAVKSVLMQKTSFPFNLIIIDNYSDDGTTELIQSFVSQDDRVIHLVPERNDLGIGGCWNEGVQSAHCGKFAIQLDSDDVYQNENTIQKIVDAFYDQQCAMVVGSYTMTNFDMQTIPPGLIDHKEWTPDNGRNNALRINGLGAPRAFYTPVLRDIKVPNTSYGEDYALGLAISRNFQIGRVYDSLYLCRRWDDNSDASLDVVKMNAHNAYKDKIRTIELKARIRMNKNTVK